jgi:hypothetical protein
MTAAQAATIYEYLFDHDVEEFHHGDCIGADATAHEIADNAHIPIVIHPPTDASKRAFCKGALVVLRAYPYLVRNHNIVESVDVMLATPFEDKEVLRSGTWATVRYARKRGIPCWLILPGGARELA